MTKKRHTMRKRYLLIKVILVYYLGQSFALAATEFIPFAGQRLSGKFTESSTGVTLDVDDSGTSGFIINQDYEAGSQIEFLYSKQSSVLRAGNPVPTSALFDIDIEYIHIGGLVLNKLHEKSKSFIGAGLGITHFSPGFSGYSSESELSFSLSAGIKHTLTEHLGFRLGARFYGTPVNKNAAVFCGNGACDINFNGDLYTQYEATLGIMLRF